MKNNKATLVIGDTHLPFEHPKYLGHCLRVRDRYKCEQVVHIGDLVDNYSSSHFPKDADAISATAEFEAAYDKVQLWQKKFGSRVTLIRGNHCVRPARAANRVNLLDRYLRSFSEVWGLTWTTADQLTLSFGTQEVLFIHGEGLGGGHSACLNAVQKYLMNVAFGHLHATAGVSYRMTSSKLLWGMAVGSGVDRGSLGLRYAVQSRLPQILSCGVITAEGVPTVVPMF